MFVRTRHILWHLLLLYAAWLLMMLVHEAGHVVGAICSGGHVTRVMWSPLSLSRTDVEPNPQPLVVTWAGPMLGATIPLLIAGLCSRWRLGYLLTFFAGFCLIANGAYLAIGALSPAGDAKDLLRLGIPRWVLIGVGTPMLIAGFWLWHRVSPRFKLARSE